MNCKAIVQELAERKIWRSLNGKTPWSTLYVAVHNEINARGDQSRFVCKEKGQYAASAHGIEVFRAAQENAATTDAEPES